MGKIIFAIIIIAVLGVGGYFIFMQNKSADTTGDQATTTAESVQVQDVTVGEGTEATPGSVVSVLYVGQLEDGTVFDSSEAHNNEPLTFTLGDPNLIAGFQLGVNGMKVGGERAIVVPASLGYGAQEVRDPDGKVVVPANSTLVFSVKLLQVEPGATSTDEGADAMSSDEDGMMKEE